jgi:superfamily II DNA or RNA helicase
VIKKFNRALKIGFSATPNYSAEKKLSNLLPTEIHSMTVREAVEEDGLISPLSSVVVKTQVDLSKVERYKDGKWKESSLAKAVNIAGRNKAAVDIYRNNFNGRFAIAYCVGVKHATKVADTFREAGIPAAHISGKMNKKIQDKILEQYNIGELKVLCNADLLIVGFDEPKTSVCFNLEPTQSAVKAEQRGGRVLRLDQANTNKHAYIIDFLDEGYFDGNGGVRQGPVLFADVVDGVRFAPKNKKKHLGGGGGGGAVQIIDLEGVEVITDEEEIMRLVRKSRDAAKPKEVKFFLPFDEFKSQVRAAGIKNNQEYTRVYKNYTNWPAAPYRIYEEEWPTGGWSEFLLGLEKKKWLTFEKIQEEVRLAGVETRDQYKQVYSQYPGWPSNPNDAYKEVWPGWPKFLGKEILGFLSFTELKIEVIAANVKSSEQYKREYGEHPGWPSNPNLTYSKEWISWPDFFENGYLSFGELKKQVKEMGISSVDHYLKEYKKHPGWPSTPHKKYKGEWLGWVEFLEKNLPFNEFQRQVREQGIVSSLDYKKKYKQYPKWPSMPENLYRNVWPGWPAFLGKK